MTAEELGSASGRISWAPGQLPRRARHLDQPRLRRRVRVRPHPHRKARGRRGQGDSSEQGAAPRAVGGADHRSSSRLRDLGRLQDNTARLRANCKPPRGEGGGAAPRGRGAAAGLVRCGRCGRIMQAGYSGKAVTRPATCAPAPSSSTAAPPARPSAGCAGQAVLAELFHGLQPGLPGGHRPGDGRRRATAQRDQVAAFELASSGPAMKPTGRRASTTRSSRRNRLVARTLEPARRKLAAVGSADTTWPPRGPATRCT